MPAKDTWSIRSARLADLSQLAAIEEDAYLSLEAAGGGWQDDAAPDPVGLLEARRLSGLLFVAADASGRPVGFLAADAHAGHFHVAEIDVLRRWQSIGIGRTLMLHAIDTAKRQGNRTVWLTTDRFAPFNAPFYRSIGFRSLETKQMPGYLSMAIAAEIARGANPHRRTGMQLELSKWPH